MSAATLGVLLFWASSCRSGKQHKVQARPASIPVRAPTPVDAKPPQIPPPAVAVEQPPSASPQLPETTPQLPGPPPVRAKKAARRAKAVAAQPAQEPVGPTAPPPGPPVTLTPLLTEADRQAYVNAISDLLGKAGRNLAMAEGRGPTPELRKLIVQARTFIAQAEELRGRDVAAAKSLAERAEILSREVLAQLR